MLNTDLQHLQNLLDEYFRERYPENLQNVEEAIMDLELLLSNYLRNDRYKPLENLLQELDVIDDEEKIPHDIEVVLDRSLLRLTELLRANVKY